MVCVLYSQDSFIARCVPHERNLTARAGVGVGRPGRGCSPRPSVRGRYGENEFVPTDNSGAPVASSFGHPDAAAAARRVSGTAFVTTVWYGLSDGAIYALIAIGF